MSKIMLVEDDNNLREIYEARLLAEGYEIIAAHDGEEALALAVKEKPDLIISDVMMPKISGFDMLDILRSTPETKDTKVIMMTALSQAEDKSRADKLGADRYLVKSQVTLEDVAKIAREVLEGDTATALPMSDPVAQTSSEPVATTPVVTAPEPVVAPAPVMTMPDPTPAVVPVAPDPAPVAAAPLSPIVEPPAPQDIGAPTTLPDPTPVVQPEPVSSVAAVTSDPVAVTQEAQSTSTEQKALDDQVQSFVGDAEALTPPSTDSVPPTEEASLAPSLSMAGKRVIQPLNDLSATPDLNKLVQDEARKSSPTITPSTAPAGDDPNLIAI